MGKPDGTAKGTTEAIRKEQRKHRRYSKQFVVHLYWLDDLGHLQDAPAVVKDISVDGFGIEAPRSFVVGQLLSVSTSAGSLQCEVCHVRALRDELHHLGVRIRSASDGSDHKRSLKNLAAATSRKDGDSG